MHAEYANKAKSEFRKTVVKVLKIVGTALAIINGFIQPLSSLVYGELTDALMIPSGGGETNVTHLIGSNFTLSGIPQDNNKQKNTSTEVLDSLNMIKNTLAGNSGNKSQSKIPSQLVLTPETDPLRPPGYGYPVLPGLVRLRPQRPKNATKSKTATGPTPADQEKKISKYAMYYCYLALATFVCSYGQMLCWNISTLSCFQVTHYESVRQEGVDNGKTDDKTDVKGEKDEGIGARITVIIQNVANLASSMLVSFIQNWQLTLMMLAAGPIIASVMFYMNKLKSIAMEKVKLLVQKARGVAKGAFSQVQTVAAFGGQDYEKSKFSNNLLAADKAATVRSIVDAVRAGLMIVIAFALLGVGFWFSSILILNGTLTPGAFISIFMAIISAVLKLVNVGGAVNVDAEKDKKEEKSMFSSDSKEENQRANVIGKILEHLSSPEELFKYYPCRPEVMMKGGNCVKENFGFYVEFSYGRNKDDRNNMSNPVPNATFVPNLSSTLPRQEQKTSQKWNLRNFKEKMKAKFPRNLMLNFSMELNFGKRAYTTLVCWVLHNISKEKKKYKSLDDSDEESRFQSKYSIGNIKERGSRCFGNVKSWLETKVLGQVKKRGLSLEAVKLQIQQLPLIVLSLVGAVMTGLIAPGFSLLLSEILIVTADSKRLEAERYQWAFKFLNLGLFIAFGTAVQKFSTSLSESRVEMGLKQNAFNSTMDESEVPKTSPCNPGEMPPSSSKQENLKTNIIEDVDQLERVSNAQKLEECEKPSQIAPDYKTDQNEKNLNLLDKPSNADTDNMTTKMDNDATSSLKSSFSLSNLTANVSGYISTFMTMFISFTNGWKMTLVVLAGLPIITYANSVQNADPEETVEEESDGIISKVWKKLRGVTASASGKIPSNNQASKFKEQCLKPYRYAVKMLIATGLAFAIAECVTFLVYAGALRYGGYLVHVGEMTVESVMTVLMTVLFGGAGSSNAPKEKSKKKNESPDNDELNDVKTHDDTDEKRIKLDDGKGEMEFHDVEIHHPEKKSVLLSGLNISVKPSETLAVVGTTDFNSNAVIALVERFYDPSTGLITLDHVDIRDMDLKWLRSQIALVSETGVLNHHSVADNLKIADTASCLSDEYLEDVARITHLHEIVENFPESYNSVVEDDVVLNEKTRQKIAITRALIRNPRILIIDEFSHPDKEVNEDLQRLCAGRICIIFAQRLSTLEKADKIVIVCHGKVIEQGTREELLRRRGLYYHLININLELDIAPAL